jgi:argininosuccinate lyase
MQEDKEAVFNVVDTIDVLMPAATGMLSTMTLEKDRIQKRLNEDYTAATDLADMLVAQGMPFREAHHLIGRLVTQLEVDRIRFMDVTSEYLERVAPEISWDWMHKLSPDAVIGRRQQAMSTSPQFVSEAIQEARQWLTHEQLRDNSYPA